MFSESKEKPAGSSDNDENEIVKKEEEETLVKVQSAIYKYPTTHDGSEKDKKYLTELDLDLLLDASEFWVLPFEVEVLAIVE